MNKQVLVSDSDSGNLHYTMLCVGRETVCVSAWKKSINIFEF